MAKASLKLPNGTTIAIEGTPQEVQNLLEFYGDGKSQHAQPIGKVAKSAKAIKSKEKDKNIVNLAEIVNLVKECEEAKVFESEILDRTSQVNRALLPLYIVNEYLGNKFGLTTGEVSKVNTDLGIPISSANVSHTFTGSAKGYVIGDVVRKRGQAVRYKLSRRGVKYMKEVLKGTKSGK